MFSHLHLSACAFNLLVEQIFDNAVFGVVLVSNDCVFLWVNNAFASMLGYTREELLGKSIEQITHPDDINLSRDFIQNLDAQPPSLQRPLTVEKRYCTKFNKTVWCRLTATVLSFPEGTDNPYNLRYMTQVENVTELVTLRKMLARFHNDVATVQHNV